MPWGSLAERNTTVEVVGVGLLDYGAVLCRFIQPG